MSRVASVRRIGAALVLTAISAGVVGGTSMVTAAGSPVAVTVRCYSNPERTTVKNNGTASFKITRVGSTYQPYSYEPFVVSKTLAPGQSVTYQTGYAAAGVFRLARTYIYNDNGQDGAKIVTTAGTITKRC